MLRMAIVRSTKMAQPYWNDLRRRFFQGHEAGEGTVEEAAKRFRVSLSWAKKISARRRKRGEIELRPWRRGPRSRVTAAHRQWIGEPIGRQPDLTLQELQRRLEQGQRLRLSRGWIGVVVRQLGLRLRKVTPRASAGQSASAAAPASVAGTARRHRHPRETTAVLRRANVCRRPQRKATGKRSPCWPR
jgi:transposase